MRRLRIFTWHIHGNYLWYLSHIPHDLYVPVQPDGRAGYSGRAGTFAWPDNIREIPVDQVRELELDCIIFQSRQAYLEDQFQILSAAQRQQPRIYVEHDPPREHPTDTRHVVDDPSVLLVHVTHFNKLMWDSGRTAACVIPHGVVVPEQARYSGTRPRGVVVINNLADRARRLGCDVFLEARQHIPLDLIGMGSRTLDGLGEIPPHDVPEFVAAYRFFFNPIRYTSLGLALCEAMMVGLPVIALATTEVVTTVQNGVSGFVATDPQALYEPMHALLQDLPLARRMGTAARAFAREQFSIQRFVHDWNVILAEAVGGSRPVFAGASA